MLARLSIAPDLESFVSGGWLLDDRQSRLAGQMVRGGIGATTVMGIQLGDPVETDFDTPRLPACLTGYHERSRFFRPVGAARVLLLFLSPAGTTQLFPGAGPATLGTSLDLAGLLGDGAVLRLRQAAAAAPDIAALATIVQAWLRGLFLRSTDGAAAEAVRLAAAASCLRRGGSVREAAECAALSERQLERIFRGHLGLGPKRYQGLHRLQRSLYSVLSGEGDPLQGFADQAHQIRNWRGALGETPGALARRGASALAARYCDDPSTRRDAYPLYL